MNMPTISQLLQYILSKRYGEEVRGAIHDAIEKCYQDVNSATLREDAFQAALQAAIDRGDIPGMVIADNSVPGTKIKDGTLPLSKLAEPVQITVDSALSDSSTNPVQNKVIKGAIDELNGSLTDFNMIKDFNIVREGLTTLDSATYLLQNNQFTPDEVTTGYYLDIETGQPVEKTGESISKFICCVGGASIDVARHVRVCFYDKYKKFISGVQGTGAANYTETIPVTADFLRISSKAYTPQSNTNLFQNTYQQVKVSAYVSDWHYVNSEIGVAWDDIIEKGTAQRILDNAQRLDYSLDIYDMIIQPDVVVPFIIGEYCRVPLTLATTLYKVTYYNSDMEVIHSVGYNSTYDYEYVETRQVLAFKDARTLIKETYVSNDEISQRIPHATETKTFNEDIAYLKFGVIVSLDRIYLTTPDILDVKHITVNTDHSTGLLEQTRDFALSDMITNFPTLDSELTRRMHAEMIWTFNNMRHAIRLCTFNRGKAGKVNWYKVKEVMQMYAPNICGLQEISSPYDGTPQFDEFFESWHFKHFSDNGDAYPVNERMLMTTEKFSIDSTVETFLSESTNGKRYVAKSVLSMPRYMDKRGTELMKMSVYNFQLEFSSTNNAQMILDMVAEDENPFIVCMGDTNDFTNNKQIYAMFNEAGLTPILGLDTATTSGEGPFECIDNFFVNHRIKPLHYDVINADIYQFLASTGMMNLSDHNIILADVQLDYSDIHTITTSITNASISVSTGRNWLSDDETVTITVTPDEGYNLAVNSNNFMLRDAGAKVKADVFVGDNTGGVITLVGSQMRGDFNIYIKAQANT